MPEGAVAEAPISTPVESSTPVSSPISEGGESSSATPVESQGKQGVEGTQASEKPTGKASLDVLLKDATKREALKAIDPSLPGLLRDAAFGSMQLKKEFPAGGLKEAIEYRDTVKQLGGPQAIKENHSALQNYDKLDAAYSEGKAEFVQQIAQSDPEAFERMVPLAIEQFAKQSPEQYQHVMSRVMVATLDQMGLPNILQKLFSTTKDADSQALIQQVWDSVESFRGLAAKIPEKKIDPALQALQQKEKEFAQKQQDSMLKGVNRESTNYRDSMIAKELKPFAKWEELDDDRKSAIVREVKARTAKLVNADESFKAQRARLLENGDSDGIIQLEKAFMNQHLPTIVSRVGKMFWANPTKQVVKSQQQQQAAKPAAKGWTVVKSIDPNKVDKRNTTRDMIFAGKAIYTDGTKVQVPA